VIHHAPKSASGRPAVQSVLLGSATNPRVSSRAGVRVPSPSIVSRQHLSLRPRSAAKDRSEWLAGTSHPRPPSSRGALEIILTQNQGGAGFPRPRKTTDSPCRRAAFAPAPPSSPARCASAKSPSIVQYPHRSSPIRPHAAPILVQPIANEESANRLPGADSSSQCKVPIRPVSWNRSSSG
jgi:hypothetical protein